MPGQKLFALHSGFPVTRACAGDDHCTVRRGGVRRSVTLILFAALAICSDVAWASGEAGEFSIQLPAGSTWIVLAICVVYFIGVLAFGAMFGRYSKDTHDFFYSGQRFPWWLVTASMIATGIGSYSFLKYSQAGYHNGLGSTMTYLNDWFVMPFFMFGWLPIIYFSRARSIPEYFERRFNPLARYLAVTIILAYMLFYIGYNLYTIGVAIQGITGISIWPAVIVSTVIIDFYVSFGGQTAVIFTDLIQGGMLYLSGAVVLVAGLVYLGGLSEFWVWLPIEQRSPMPPLNATPKFSTSNIFWGEGIADSIAFTFMNQGFIMRYLAVKSVNEGRKAARPMSSSCCRFRRSSSGALAGSVAPWSRKGRRRVSCPSNSTIRTTRSPPCSGPS